MVQNVSIPSGRTLIIAIQQLISGKGAAGAEFARYSFNQLFCCNGRLRAQVTTAMWCHGRRSCVTDTVVALGGDGVIHEVANSLMTYRQKRPVGIIPVGSKTTMHALWV